MMLKHVGTIQALVETLTQSHRFHALVVQSPPGWAKSTTIDQALQKQGRPFVALGSYATALHIYNTLCEHPTSLIVLDDSAGLFSDQKTMAVLKAATWQSSGGMGEPSSRRVTWGSASEKVAAPEVDFRGKLILLTNVLPAGKDAEAFLSRCLSYRIHVGEQEARTMLQEAARSSLHFENPELAEAVAAFLCDERNGWDLLRVNLRTLQMGYELAVTHPSTWRDLFGALLPQVGKQDTLASVFTPGLPTEEQFARFQARTGKSRRSYYYEKKKLGLSRAYRTD